MFGKDKLQVNNDGHLVFGGVDAMFLAGTYGTPVYVLDEERIRTMCKTMVNSMSRVCSDGLVLYASKALCCKGIYNIIKEEKMGIDVVSLGELLTAISVNFPPERIYMHGNNKTIEEITQAIEYGVNTIVLDSFDDIDIVASICKEHKTCQKVLLRVNPHINVGAHRSVQTGAEDSKFGLSISSGMAMNGIDKILSYDNLDFYGLHCHIGSQILQGRPFRSEANALVKFAISVKERHGINIREFNMGGGFGVWYNSSDGEIDLKMYQEYICDMTDKINNAVDAKLLAKPKFVIEPGRSIVAAAGITLYTVGNQKHIENIRDYVSVNGGMFENPRYALYGAKYTAVVASDMNRTGERPVTITGKCCECGDMIAVDTTLPEVKRGDILAVLTTGAYNYSMASNYNRNLIPPVVLVYNGQHGYLVKPQTYEQMMQNDVALSFKK